MKLRIATSQFSVSSNIELNKKNIIEQIKTASEKKCNVIHFPEGSLSGYAGVDFFTFENYNWELLKRSSLEIREMALQFNIWVILGSAHPLSFGNKPHNSLYIINNIGQLVDRYDKRFCAGDDKGESGDLLYYSSGNQFSFFAINGVNCSVQICHDYRYPELYRELKRNNVQLVFHSYHAANMNSERKSLMESQIGQEYYKWNNGKTYPEITMPATMVSYAANNYLWISCSNSSAKESCWGSFIVRPGRFSVPQTHCG